MYLYMLLITLRCIFDHVNLASISNQNVLNKNSVDSSRFIIGLASGFLMYMISYEKAHSSLVHGFL